MAFVNRPLHNKRAQVVQCSHAYES